MNTFKAKKEREGDDSRVETTLEHNNRKKEGEKKIRFQNKKRKLIRDGASFFR